MSVCFCVVWPQLHANELCTKQSEFAKRRSTNDERSDNNNLANESTCFNFQWISMHIILYNYNAIFCSRFFLLFWFLAGEDLRTNVLCYQMQSINRVTKCGFLFTTKILTMFDSGFYTVESFIYIYNKISDIWVRLVDGDIHSVWDGHKTKINSHTHIKSAWQCQVWCDDTNATNTI